MAAIKVTLLQVLIISCNIYYSLGSAHDQTCGPNDTERAKVCKKDLCIFYQGKNVASGSRFEYNTNRQVEIECHDNIKVRHMMSSKLRLKKDDSNIESEVKDCKNLKKTITLSTDTTTTKYACIATHFTGYIFTTKTAEIIFRYVPDVTSTTTTTTTTTKISTTKSTSTTTSTTTSTVPPTTTSTVPPTTTSTVPPTTTTKATTTTTTMTTTPSPTPTETLPPTILPTTTLQTTTISQTTTSPQVTTTTQPTTTRMNDQKTEQEVSPTLPTTSLPTEPTTKDASNFTTTAEDATSFWKENIVALSVGAVVSVIVIVAAVVVTCVVTRSRKKVKEDKTQLNPNGSRDNLDVTPINRNNTRSEPKLNNFYTDINNDNAEVYSDPYMASYTQPLPKHLRKPPKDIPKPKPKPKAIPPQNYSNTYDPDYNEALSYNYITNNTGTMYNNIGKTLKNRGQVHFYDNTAAGYSNADHEKFSAVYSEPGLYEVPS